MVEISVNDLHLQETLRNPAAFFAHLREQDPLIPLSGLNGIGVRGAWITTTYDGALAVLKDPRFINSEWKFSQPPHGETSSRMSLSIDRLPVCMATLDPPDHTRLRSLVSKAFAPHMIEQFRPRIQRITDKLLDAVEEQGAMDLVIDFAVPLPLTVTAEILGIPSTDYQQFSSLLPTLLNTLLQLQQEEAGIATLDAFFHYIETLLSSKREHPSNDLMSELIRAEEHGDSLSTDELITMIFLLIVAGYVPLLSLIGNGMLTLLLHPEQMRLLQQDPSLLPSAIEELLRYTSTLSLPVTRWASEDIPLYGKMIRKGEAVFISLTAANTDPQQFTDPDVLDIRRQENKHIAFSKGIHTCLGAPLVRLVGQIAIGTVLRRFPSLRLTSEPEQLTWHPSRITRTLTSLPVAF